MVDCPMGIVWVDALIMGMIGLAGDDVKGQQVQQQLWLVSAMLVIVDIIKIKVKNNKIY